MFNESCKTFLKHENVPKLNAEQQNTLEGLITADECLAILKTFAKKKKKNARFRWPYGRILPFFRGMKSLALYFIAILMPMIVVRCPSHKEDPRRGVISLIRKTNKDNLLLKNWPPISLLNTDYKIATKCLANRLKKVLTTLINRDQSGYVKNRFVGENVRLISDFIDLYEKRNLSRVLFFYRFRKSFRFSWMAVLIWGP